VLEIPKDERWIRFFSHISMVAAVLNLDLAPRAAIELWHGLHGISQDDQVHHELATWPPCKLVGMTSSKAPLESSISAGKEHLSGTIRSLISEKSFLLTHCPQICVRKEISRPGFLDVSRYSVVLEYTLSTYVEFFCVIT
jgi:hypothetical protein